MSLLLRYGGSLAGPSCPRVSSHRWLPLKRKEPGAAKPPILPPSKTRLYRVPQYRWLNPGDVADLLWRRHAYNNAISSMRQLFREEIEQKQRLGVGYDRVKGDERAELERKLEANERQNRVYAEERTEREKLVMEKVEEQTLEEIERRLDWDAENVAKRAKEVEEFIEKSKRDFVSRENLDEKIADALENPINFDYAIDLQGTQIPNPAPRKYLHDPSRERGRMYDLEPGFDLVQTTRPPIPGLAYSRNQRNRSQDGRKGERRGGTDGRPKGSHINQPPNNSSNNPDQK